jgi:hypothetical protein
VTANGSVAAAWAKCSKVYSAPGGDPSDIFPTLNAAGNNVQIIPSNGDQTHEIQVPGGGVIIFWDPADNHPYVGGGNAEACSTLYHELVHAYQDLTGGQNHAMCWTPGPNGTLVNSGIPANEVEATQEQNQPRQTLGLPVRKTYGDKPLPSGACQPPPANPTTPNCNGAGCGNSNGDPHLITFEGVHYDFQAAGEFIAADDPRDGFQLQLRQQPFPGSLKVSVNTAAAMDVAGDRVEVDMGTQGLVLLVNGVPQSAATLTLPHGGTVATGMTGTGQLMTITWPDSSVATINQIGPWGLHDRQTVLQHPVSGVRQQLADHRRDLAVHLRRGHEHRDVHRPHLPARSGHAEPGPRPRPGRRGVRGSRDHQPGRVAGLRARRRPDRSAGLRRR